MLEWWREYGGGEDAQEPQPEEMAAMPKDLPRGRSRRMRVAAAQIHVTDQIGENLDTISQTISRCAADGVEVVLFPETSLTGYSPAIGHGRGASEWPAVQDGLGAVGRLARESGIWVVLGAEALDNGAWVNRLYAFSDAGQVAGTYDKVHLTDSDTCYYRAGTRNTLFQMRGVTVGLQICYDARFPEGYRSLLHQGAEVIMQGFYGAGSNTWKVPVLGAHLRSRAAESGCFVIAANVVGPLQIVVSQIIDPLGLVMTQANQDREEVITADLDLSRLGDSEIRRDYLERFRATPAK